MKLFMFPFLFFSIYSLWFADVLIYRCMLHNFAGNIEMYGVLDSMASGPVEARMSENSTMASLLNVYCFTIS